MDGQWRAAVLAMREDRGGDVLVHVDIHLPEYAGPLRRTYRWDPAAVRVVEDGHRDPVEVEFDAEGRVAGPTRPPA